MPTTKKLLVKGVNQDDSEYLMDAGEYLNALNMRFASTEDGSIGKMSSIEGTLIKNQTINSSGATVTWTLPSGTNEVIGSYSDIINRKLFWFNWNSNGSHGIYCYNADADRIYTVLLSTDVVGGLNFQRNRFIHSCGMVGDLLYWTDDYNEPRRININSGISLYHPTIITADRAYVLDTGGKMDSSIISLARPLPAFAPSANYVNVAAEGDAIFRDGFQACYRFIYKDKEVSVFSPLSTLLRGAQSGYIEFSIPTTQKIPQDVDKIELAVRYYSDKRMLIFKTWDRLVDLSKFNTHNSGTSGQLVYKFYNKEIGVAVDNATSVKLFDSVPLLSGTMEIARNRVFLGDTLSGYDTPRTTSLASTTATSSASGGLLTYKSGASYKVGLIFYDKFGRSSGVITNDSLTVNTQDRTETPTTMVTSINWTLSNSNRLNEIPAWAHSYSIVRTKARNKSFFLQFKPSEIKNVSRNTDGTYNLTATTNLIGLAFRTNELSKYGLGYTLNHGDIALIYNGTADPIRVSVIDTFSDYVITEFTGSITTSDEVVMEIYSPAAQASNEFYYEVGNKYLVSNPGTGARAYSTISGSITGDVVLVNRAGYYAEVMNLNDKVWRLWLDNTGKTFLEVNDVVKRRPTNVVYSNVFSFGVNGLSTFDTLDFYLLPIELGTIEKLVLTSKVQLEGNVMLAICSQDTASVYLGESQVFDATGASFLAKASGVIGQVNVMRGSYGTIHPESVTEWEGSVIFFDANKGAWVRYDVNGLFPISAYKMQKYFRKVGQDIMNYFKNPAEYNLATPDQPLRVIGAIDPYHGEWLSTMPRMFIEPKNEVLADMEITSTAYNFSTTNPSIVATPETLTGFTYSEGSGPSASQSFTVTGTGLDIGGSITVTGSTDYEVSLDDVSFLSSLSYSYLTSSSTKTIYVRLKANKVAGTYNSQTITVSGSGSSDTVVVSGSVSANPNPVIILNPTVVSGFTYVSGAGPSASQTIAMTAANLSPASGNITVTAPTDFEVSADDVSFSASINVAYTSGTLASTNIYVRLKSGRSVGTYAGQILTASGGSASASATLGGSVTSGGTPTLYRFIVGLGNTAGEACSDSISAPSAVFSDRDTDTFGVGAMIYTSAAGTTPLTGFSFIFINGALWDISNGLITGYSSVQC